MLSVGWCLDGAVWLYVTPGMNQQSFLPSEVASVYLYGRPGEEEGSPQESSDWSWVGWQLARGLSEDSRAAWRSVQCTEAAEGV